MKRRAQPADRSTSVCGAAAYKSPEVMRGEPHGLEAQQQHAKSVAIVWELPYAPPPSLLARTALHAVEEMPRHEARSHTSSSYTFTTQAQLWSLGVLLVEVAAGAPTFGDSIGDAEAGSPLSLQARVLEGEPELGVSSDGAAALASALLQKPVDARARSFPKGYASVMETGWLAGLDWAGLEAGRCVADLDFAAHASAAAGQDLMPRPAAGNMAVYGGAYAEVAFGESPFGAPRLTRGAAIKSTF